MTKFIALLLALSMLAVFSLSASAQTVVGVHIGSVHLPKKPGQNNENPGLFVRHGSLQAGFYQNTVDRPTVYAGYVQPIGPVDVMVGLASGYKERCTTTTLPAVLVKGLEGHKGLQGQSTTYTDCKGFSKAVFVPVLAFSYKAPEVFGMSPRISFLPGIAKHASVVHLSLEWSL